MSFLERALQFEGAETRTLVARSDGARLCFHKSVKNDMHRKICLSCVHLCFGAHVETSFNLNLLVKRCVRPNLDCKPKLKLGKFDERFLKNDETNEESKIVKSNFCF